VVLVDFFPYFQAPIEALLSELIFPIITINTTKEFQLISQARMLRPEYPFTDLLTFSLEVNRILLNPHPIKTIADRTKGFTDLHLFLAIMP
jgi:hypothetical protein